MIRSDSTGDSRQLLEPSQVRRSVILLVLLVTAAGCAYRPPSPELLDAVKSIPAPPGPAVRREITVTFDGPRRAGFGQGALAARTGDHVHLRVQLLADVGTTRWLDLAVTPTGVAARSLIAGDLERRWTEGPAEPGALLVLGVTLEELLRPITAQRVVGVRPAGDGREIALRPHASGVRLSVVVDAATRIMERRFTLGALTWTARTRREDGRSVLTIVALGDRIDVVTVDEEIVQTLPDALFELESAP